MKEHPTLETRSATIQTAGFSFKDLNRNGRLDKYEDWRLSPEERSRNLRSQMTLEQKAGMTVVVISYANPFMIGEIYNKQTEDRFLSILATFGAEPEALLDVVTGKFNPSAKMPFTTPISQQTVENNQEDVPGYDEGEDYALFEYDEALSYE